MKPFMQRLLAAVLLLSQQYDATASTPPPSALAPAESRVVPNSQRANAAMAALRPPSRSVLDRFLAYVRIDTQAKENQESVPSTAKQLDLSRLLATELRELGCKQVELSDCGIVYARIPGTLAGATEGTTIGFLAHLDTAPELSGANVKPTVHKAYKGGSLPLPGDPTLSLTPEQNPELLERLGDDIITSDGTTLLGADDKAGIAEIMTMIDIFRNNPELCHGPLSIAFTPDEEVGSGIEKLDLAHLGARYAYTVDGYELGTINDETFIARTVTVTFKGRGTHIGVAKGKLINSLYAAADFVGRLPVHLRPEENEGRQGFIHPAEGILGAEDSSLVFMLRGFERETLEKQESVLRQLLVETQSRFPAVKTTLVVKPSYSNMKDTLRLHPLPLELAIEATRRVGLKPRLVPIRGGSDGCELCERGLPTPNLFTGAHTTHSRIEWITRGELEKSTEMLVQLALLWAGK